jgi:hypothetical protein
MSKVDKISNSSPDASWDRRWIWLNSEIKSSYKHIIDYRFSPIEISITAAIKPNPTMTAINIKIIVLLV